MKKPHTERDKEIMELFTADRTAMKLLRSAPPNEIYFMDSLAFREKDFVIDGKIDQGKLEELIKGFYKHLEGKNLREYRKQLKNHLKRLRITYQEWKEFNSIFLFNANIDRVK